MSGHSHWHSIKHQKAAADAKKGQAFSKIARLITIAARQKGGDPETNASLRLAIEKARSFNMPKENIERAIERGTGEIAGEKLEEITFEGFGPGGIAIIIEGITDNKNRALAEIKQILSQNGGKLAQEGSVRWLFEKRGVITINPEDQIPRLPSAIAEDIGGQAITRNKEDLELIAIETGADDIYWHKNLLDIYTKAENLETVKQALEEKGIKINSASLDWVAKEMIEVDEKNKETAEQLFEALDENEAVQDIYSNLKV